MGWRVPGWTGQEGMEGRQLVLRLHACALQTSAELVTGAHAEVGCAGTMVRRQEAAYCRSTDESEGDRISCGCCKEGRARLVGWYSSRGI